MAYYGPDPTNVGGGDNRPKKPWERLLLGMLFLGGIVGLIFVIAN